jgi:curli production assembly/transport component CsgG/holdfast attachment protein HfaB
VVDATTFQTVYVTSLQKQIVGNQVEAGVYRFFDNQLVEFDAGTVRNEPLQLGVRSVVEMAAYQILTEGLGLPINDTQACQVADGHYPAA